MDIKELIALQKEFDEKHGWRPKGEKVEQIVNAVSDDIVGIVGEIGEFSNIVKKLLITKEKPEEFIDLWEKRRADLHEELTDTFVYLMRIASHLDIDLEKEYLNKLKYNEEKYRRFEK